VARIAGPQHNRAAGTIPRRTRAASYRNASAFNILSLIVLLPRPRGYQYRATVATHTTAARQFNIASDGATAASAAKH
jgi:hypothetical protein